MIMPMFWKLEMYSLFLFERIVETISKFWKLFHNRYSIFGFLPFSFNSTSAPPKEFELTHFV